MDNSSMEHNLLIQFKFNKYIYLNCLGFIFIGKIGIFLKKYMKTYNTNNIPYWLYDKPEITASNYILTLTVSFFLLNEA